MSFAARSEPDLPPARARVRYPSLVAIGAMRSGTTSFHRLLAAHPDIFMSPIKGPGLFIDPAEPIDYPSKYACIAEKHEHRSELELLAAMRVGYRGERHFGESTDLYTRYPSIGAVAPGRMLAANPDLRLIYLLRDPVERLLSQFRYEQSKPRKPAPRCFEEYLASSPDAFSTSQYQDQLMRYLKAGFALAQILLIVLEELVRDPPRVMSEVMRFLELEDCGGWQLPHLNGGCASDAGPTPTAARRLSLHAALRPQREGIEELLGRRIPAWGPNAQQAASAGARLPGR